MRTSLEARLAFVLKVITGAKVFYSLETQFLNLSLVGGNGVQKSTFNAQS